jgi:hypothetical protein
LIFKSNLARNKNYRQHGIAKSGADRHKPSFVRFTKFCTFTKPLCVLTPPSAISKTLGAIIDRPNNSSMDRLIIEKLLHDGTDLILEVDEATVEWNNNVLKILVHFPEKYTTDDLVWDEAGNNVISEPIDFNFKEDDATLELEMLIENVDTINDLLDREITIDSEIDDDLTNFLITNNHHPTFNDKITISKTDNGYILKWTGFVPDINYYDFDKSMERQFTFTLTTKCTLTYNGS